MGDEKVGSQRQRLTWTAQVVAPEEAAPVVASLKEAAGGLYGYPKMVQSSCESCSRRLAKTATAIARRIYAKDPGVVDFLQTHAKRGKSRTAKVLLAAMREVGPKVETEPDESVETVREAAATTDYGLYGFKGRTADLGLAACTELKSTAGRYASDLHRRRAAEHERITGFLKEHSKQARDLYASMILDYYPDRDMKIASVSEPAGVAGWLSWED